MEGFLIEMTKNQESSYILLKISNINNLLKMWWRQQQLIKFAIGTHSLTNKKKFSIFLHETNEKKVKWKAQGMAQNLPSSTSSLDAMYVIKWKY